MKEKDNDTSSENVDNCLMREILGVSTIMNERDNECVRERDNVE